MNNGALGFRRWSVGGVCVAVPAAETGGSAMIADTLNGLSGGAAMSTVDPDVVVAARPGAWAGETVLVCGCRPLDCHHALAQLQAGAASAVVTDAEVSTVLPAMIRAVAAGCRVVSEKVATACRPLQGLTSRQVAVLRAVRREQTNCEITESLHLSLATVKRELRVLCAHFGVRGRAGLAAATSGDPGGALGTPTGPGHPGGAGNEPIGGSESLHVGRGRLMMCRRGDHVATPRQRDVGGDADFAPPPSTTPLASRDRRDHA